MEKINIRNKMTNRLEEETLKAVLTDAVRLGLSIGIRSKIHSYESQSKTVYGGSKYTD